MAEVKYRIPAITQERIREVVSYDPNTGLFVWISPTGRRKKPGDIAGTKSKDGHLYIGIDGVRIGSHRWAWLYVYGSIPTCEIDHINGDPADNRICNLRLATRSQNMMNTSPRSTNSSGYKGVSFDRKSRKWHARLWKDYKCYHLGYFDSAEEASDAYMKAAVKMHGEYAWTP